MIDYLLVNIYESTKLANTRERTVLYTVPVLIQAYLIHKPRCRESVSIFAEDEMIIFHQTATLMEQTLNKARLCRVSANSFQVLSGRGGAVHLVAAKHSALIACYFNNFPIRSV